MALQPLSSQLVKEPSAEPIPGYRLIEPIGKGGFGEVWKCEAPGGLFKAIKFVQGRDESLSSNDLSGAEQELRSLQYVKSIRHPFLLSLDRVEHVGGELAIVMELADRSLHDLLVEYRLAGRNGIPRAELLGYMRETAEVLDLMNQEYGLQHLDIKPRNLFLVHQHVKVADFGLVNSLAELHGQNGESSPLAAITPIYAAPETFARRVTLFTDQYSLAVVYCELLAGQLPFSGKNFRQLALQHTSEPPDLSGLPEGDRAIVARALAKEPRERFASCLDFVRALIAQPELSAAEKSAGDRSEARTPRTTVTQDIRRVEQKKTAAVARPTKLLRSNSGAHLTPVPPQPDDPATLDSFHFLDCLGRTPLGELWRVESPEGKPLLVKLVNTFSPGMGEESAAAQLRAIRHRGLLPATVMAHRANRLAVVTDPIKDCLASRMRECQARGQAGIPRLELLGYLLTAARTLDELQQHYGLQHLGLNPRNLMLVRGNLQIADFGLMALIWLPGGQLPAQINPRYSAPELFERRLSKACDQYSLGLIFYELLTGDQVHGSRTPSQLARVRNLALDCLDLLPAPDRPILTQALDPESANRFPSCVELIRALVENTPGGEDLLERDSPAPVHEEIEELKPVRREEPPALDIDLVTASRVISAIVRDLAGTRELRAFGTASFLFSAGKEIEHRCHARLVPGTLRLKLSGFVEQWQADFVSEEAERFLFQMRLQASMWRRVLGGQPAIEMDIRAVPPSVPGATLTEVSLALHPVGCGQEEGALALEKWGPRLIDSLRTHLQVGPERRKQLRFPFERLLKASPLTESNRIGQEIECLCRDISLGGMGLYLPLKPPSQLLLKLARAEGEEAVDVPAQVVRSQPDGTGHFEVGLRFLSSP